MSAEKGIDVAAVGDVLDINTWSNIPYFFYKAGKEAGIFSRPWRLDVTPFTTPRIVWNAKQVMLGRGAGGFQYSDEFIDACEKQVPSEYFSSTIISFNQVFPRAASVKKANGRIFYYIDATLHDLFNSDVYNIRIPARMRSIALETETRNYQQADGIVTMGRWAQEALFDFYKIDRSKVFQVLPGANIDVPSDFHPKPFTDGAGTSRDLTLGFIGKDWQRKGLPLLLDVRDKLQASGLKTKVVVIGNMPEELKDREGIVYGGFIDKESDTQRFIDIVSGCDFGCLFSSSEALGISTLEFLRLGVPVMGFDHQGLKDTLIDGASLRFNINDDATVVARTISSVVQSDQMQFLKEEAIRQRNSVTWNVCVNKWADIIR